MGVGGTVGWAVGLTFGSVLLGWMAKRSRWSLWPVVLWHGNFDFFTTSDQLDPLVPGAMSVMVINVVAWVVVRYGPDL